MSDTAPPAPPEKLDRLVWWLDEAVPIPGTSLRVGADAIVGFLLPGAGDALTAAAGVSLVVAAYRRRVPLPILARMVGNLLIDAVAGAVPLVGDLFDVSFRANRRNLDLLQAHRESRPARLTGPEWLTVAGLSVLALLAISIPLAAVAALAWVAGASMG